ncbi:MAG TPA: PAS domain-containing sensor histidine kinase [Myxococcales bacterium]|nr:PAS domain-containing sensor histidine kinase [Myxococcales bacterium]
MNDDRTLYDNAPCGLVSMRDGLIERANATFCIWLGYSPEELIGKVRLQDLLTVGCRIFHQTHWVPLLQMQGSVAEVQLEFLTREKRVVSVLVNAVRRLLDGAAHDDVAVFVATDRRKYERELLLARKHAEELLLSERTMQVQLNEALREREKEAQQRAVLAEQLIGIVSHDLRTPLHAILLGAKLLIATKVTPVQERTVGRILSATNRASRLIADLLDFTQARLGGGLGVTAEPLDLHALAAEAVDELKLAWPGRELLHQQSGDGQCAADPDRLQQVVTNLVSNALTYGLAGRPVTVTTRTDGDSAMLEVHNFGPVIPDDLMPHLFEPMRRGEQQVAQGSRSVGLGLYIVQQIALAHGGKVSVSSTLAEGTSFTLTLQR